MLLNLAVSIAITLVIGLFIWICLMISKRASIFNKDGKRRFPTIFFLCFLVLVGCSNPAATNQMARESATQPDPTPANTTTATQNPLSQNGQGEPQKQPQQTPLQYDWIDPNTTPPSGALYELYDTPARGANTQGSYLVYLPPSYATAITRRYPVIYWLHGGFGYQSDGGRIAIPSFAAAMAAGKMPETIIVVPQALPSGWYCNSKDSARPVENVLIQNLVPHIDTTYRTIAVPKARGIEGMSMGGYGALHLGLKYPTIFGVISAIAPAIHQELSDEPVNRTADTFFDDQAYFESNSPWGIVENSASAIVAANPILRILGGSNDTGLESDLIKFDQYLTANKIAHTWSESQGAGHDYTEILTKSQMDPYQVWKDAFSN
jgi:enterochelin esterase-like enzyme